MPKQATKWQSKCSEAVWHLATPSRTTNHYGHRWNISQGDEKSRRIDLLLLQAFGQEISNPVGLAAGFDKDGEAIDGM